MRKDKSLALQWRKSGKSYGEIRDALRIPKSTLSNWFHGVDWSDEMAHKLSKAAQVHHAVRIRELDRIRGAHLAQVYIEARLEAQEDLKELRYNPLFIAGLMLYWGEGDKSFVRNGVKLSNTDPKLIQLYVHFLKHACHIPAHKIKAHVLIYPDLDEKSCLEYWSKASGLPLTQFTKCVRILGRHKTKRLGRGVCLISVSSTYFKIKMLEWLKIFPGELMEKRYYESI